MNAEAKSIELTRDNRSHGPLNSAEHHTLRIAQKPERSPVERLIDLANSILREAQTVAGDKALADNSRRLQELDLSEGINFFGEVRQFETSLIRLALARTGGHQAQAARLLNIKPTTLNSKIKLYGIEY